jgi:hypothetical protein
MGRELGILILMSSLFLNNNFVERLVIHRDIDYFLKLMTFDVETFSNTSAVAATSHRYPRLGLVCSHFRNDLLTSNQPN